MELVISHDEVKELIESEYQEGIITEKQMKQALKDTEFHDLTEWVEQNSIFIEFKTANITLSTYNGKIDNDMTVFVRD